MTTSECREKYQKQIHQPNGIIMNKWKKKRWKRFGLETLRCDDNVINIEWLCDIIISIDDGKRR